MGYANTTTTRSKTMTEQEFYNYWSYVIVYNWSGVKIDLGLILWTFLSGYLPNQDIERGQTALMNQFRCLSNDIEIELIRHEPGKGEILSEETKRNVRECPQKMILIYGLRLNDNDTLD